MPKRKSTREHLLNTGAMIVGESGLRALTVRGLSLRAGTNTGSFVYHFGNREAFLTELLERTSVHRHQDPCQHSSSGL